MGCQKKIATEIVNGGGDYLLAVKGNQKRLETALDNIFNIAKMDADKENAYAVQGKVHGHLETQLHMVSHDVEQLGGIALKLSDLKTLGYVVGFRQEGDKPMTDALVRFY